MAYKINDLTALGRNLDPTDLLEVSLTGATGSRKIAGSELTGSLEINYIDRTIWNNGKGNVNTNTSFGESALVSNTTGGSNVAIGGQALNANTTQSRNVAIGMFSSRLATANDNTAVGATTLYNTTTGNNNVVVGKDAGYSITTGVGNIYLGVGIYPTTGSNNIGIGLNALQNLTTGSRNVMIGRYSTAANASVADSVVLGDAASANSNSVVIGSAATDDYFGSCVVLGRNAVATAANQFVVGSASYPTGTITTETLPSTQTWSVRINGSAYKILLA